LKSSAAAPAIYAGTRGLPYAGGTSDAFLVKLAADGSAYDYAFLFGGDRADEAWDVAVDAAGNSFVTGRTESRNFPVVGASTDRQAKKWGQSDAFVAQFDPAGAQTIFSIHLGGSNREFGQGIALDGAGCAYVVGRTHSGNFITTNALQARFGGARTDAFITKLITAPCLTVTPAGQQIVVSWLAPTPEFVLETADDPDGAWQPVTEQPVLWENHNVVALPASTTCRFFRLRLR
jgi:hypothetical protein